ncbi:MAG: BlaI/MecI/CopY family transcriptional regulator [Verrucomicrobiaceae bacterium]|nr:MAG: BlaI/MecI/CopY family transcriptional regulator [Verrucomicrobiaceae bacterium]
MKTPEISEAEWTVMEALWQRSPQTASAVAKTLKPSTGWALNTVRTMLTRLVEKGVLHAVENPSGVREFSPAIEREACVRAESKTFLDRVFQGAAKPLLVHFATNSKLSKDELRELKQLFEKELKNKS